VLWDSLERVAGSGTLAGASFYTADDPAPYTGESFYRLIQTDFDGKQTYSTVCAVNIQSLASTISVFPNPAVNAVVVSFPVAGQYAVALLNPAGQWMTGRVLSTGGNVILNVSQMAAGVYFIVIGQGNKTEMRKVVIRR
jgi:hypothetical protein